MKKLALIAAMTVLTAGAFSQELTAKQIRSNAVSKEDPEAAIEYVNSEIKKLTADGEKRAAYIFLGTLQEAVSKFSEAQKSYAAAAGLAGSAEGMPKKSSERLVLDATRCALSGGDYDSAESYLNSAVRNSKSPDIQAQIKLYEQWCVLSRAQIEQDLLEPVAMLKAYLTLPSMQTVKPSILLTLWYLTAEQTYSNQLNKEFPSSLEAGIVNGKVQIYPAPFWYFLPRKTAAQPVIKTEEEKLPETKSTAKTEEKVTKLQLGLFRDKNNAQTFVERLKEKGFTASIQQDTRASGTTYFIVVVNEDSTGTVADHLRSAGFECYPIF